MIAFCRYLVLLVIFCCMSGELIAENMATTSVSQVIKSDLDARNYRYLILPNQLRVLLVSDPQAQSAAAALNISVGSNQNPVDRPGLAHFLEHVILLGSYPYPNNGYQDFIAQSGGSHNAFTLADTTSFYFTLDHNALEPALDRFAQLFISPMFDSAAIDAERKVLDAEFSSNYRDDARREMDVIRELLNPRHPAAGFAVGNSDVLADFPDDAVRDDLMQFYHRWYSSDRMSLVVMGSQPVSQLQTWVETKFANIPLREVAAPEIYPPLFESGFLPASVDIVSEKNSRRLSFRFPVPLGQKTLLTKPYDYISHMLGHENKGSFISMLKDLGWAENLHAGLDFKTRQNAFFQINIQLTEAGLRAREQILSLLFFVIDQLKTEGLTEWRYQELQQMADIGFRFNEKQSPANSVVDLAQAVQDYPSQYVLRGPWLYPGFNEQELRESLAWLRPDNLLQVLMAPDVQAFRVSSYYAAPYAVRRGIADVLPIKPSVRQRFALPPANPFIPEKLVVKSGSWLSESAIKDKPELLVDKDATHIWYQQDHQYNRPYSGINLRLILPPVQVTAERSALHYLFAAMMNDQLNDRIYFARLAGISLSIQPHSRGMDLRIFGFSNRQSLLINHTINALNNPQFTPAQFYRIKNRLLRLLQNQKKESPYMQLIGNLPSLLMSPDWTANELAAALEQIDYLELLQFSRQFLWDARINGLIYGNYLPQEAMKLSAIIEHGLQSRQTGRAVPDLLVRIIPLTQAKPEFHKFNFDHQDKLLALYLQAPSASVKDAASMILLRQILQPAFFQTLRTEQQSGYLVAVLPLPLLQLEGSLLLVQSPDVSEAELQQRVDKFLDEQIPLIKRSFAQNQSSLVASLQQSARSISEQNNRYWNSILIGDKDFTYQDDLLRAIQLLQPDELISYYRQVFQNKHRRMWLSTAELSVETAQH